MYQLYQMYLTLYQLYQLCQLYQPNSNFLSRLLFRWLGGWENEINLTGTKLQIVS